MSSNRRMGSSCTADGSGGGRTPLEDSCSSWGLGEKKGCSSVEQKEAVEVGSNYSLMGWTGQMRREIQEPITTERKENLVLNEVSDNGCSHNYTEQKKIHKSLQGPKYTTISHPFWSFPRLLIVPAF